jgi:dGTPase
VIASAEAGEVAMPAELANCLSEFRRFNYERVYLRDESAQQASDVIAVLRALVEYFAARPEAIPGERGLSGDAIEATTAAVTYVAGMTDRYAFDLAVERLGWPVARLPRGVDVPGGRRA